MRSGLAHAHSGVDEGTGSPAGANPFPVHTDVNVGTAVHVTTAGPRFSEEFLRLATGLDLVAGPAVCRPAFPSSCHPAHPWLLSSSTS